MAWQDQLVAAIGREVMEALGSSAMRTKVPLLYEAWRALEDSYRDDVEAALSEAIRRALAGSKPNKALRSEA